MTDDSDLKSSGDPLADRRYGYGEMLREAGDPAAAADLFRQAAELAPLWPPAWIALGDAEAALGRADAALDAWREGLRLDPADRMGVELRLARAGLAPAPDTAPEGYVRALFDDYAPGFDRALVERLGYGTPAAIRALVDEIAPEGPVARVLDLGCGTGLTGEALRARAGWLEGVDLAPGMLVQARAKGVFDALAEGEAVRFLEAGGPAFDLIAAGDVAPYLGALDALFAGAAARLAPGGLLVLSVEAGEGEDWRLRPSLRYAHSAGYLARTAAAQGLEEAALRPIRLRRDGAEWIAGLLAAFRRPAGAVAALQPPPAALSRPRARGR